MEKVSISLPAHQWHLLQKLLDGCADAGACEGGNTEEEQGAIHAFEDQFFKKKIHEKAKRGFIFD